MVGIGNISSLCDTKPLLPADMMPLRVELPATVVVLVLRVGCVTRVGLACEMRLL